MKKCPFCNADVAENARFCLYCMKPLNEKTVVKQEKKKKKWWLIILTAVLLLFISLFTLCFILSDKTENSTDKKTPIFTENDITETEEAQTQMENPSEKVFDFGNNKNEIGSDTVTNNNVKNTNQEKTHTTESTTQNQNKITADSEKAPQTTVQKNPSNIQQDTTAVTSNNSQEEEKNPATTTQPTSIITTQNNTVTKVNWNYRSAYSSDYDKRYNKIETKDAIVITGIQEIASNGIYKIPQTIDGKTVVAIDMSSSQGYTFNSSSVKNNVRKVYLPPALNKIAYGTFSECINLTDVYISGDYLYADPSVFPPKAQRTGTLTIHTNPNSWCLYGAKYFDVYCSQYGPNEYYARWEEWNDNMYN